MHKTKKLPKVCLKIFGDHQQTAILACFLLTFLCFSIDVRFINSLSEIRMILELVLNQHFPELLFKTIYYVMAVYAIWCLLS